PGVDVSLRGGSVGEEAGGFDDDVDPEVSPGKVLRVPFGERADLRAVDDEVLLIVGDVVTELAQNGVPLEQVGVCLGVCEVGDGNDLDVRTFSGDCAVEVTADAANAIDSDADGHSFLLARRSLARTRNVFPRILGHNR